MPRSRSRQSKRTQSPEETRSPRSSRARRADLSGLDLNPEEVDDDEEYSEQMQEDEDEEDGAKNDSEDNEEEEVISKRNSRKRKIDSDEDEDDDKVEEDGIEDEEDGEEEEEEEEEDQEEEEEEEEEKKKPIERKVQIHMEDKRRGPKKRGRKRTRLTITDDGFFDEEGNTLNIIDDEVVLDDEDPKGKEKIDENGNLQGNRQFRMKVFTVLGNGDKKFMISTEPARLVGFRDSYLLFKTHRNLFKKVCTHEEKIDLIDRHIIPNSYKGRSVNLVAARSIFREFGARIIKEGKKVIDDFWEQRAIDNGDVPGEYADPAELYGNLYKQPTVLGDTGSNAGTTPIAGAPVVSYQSDPTWMYQIALKTREYNSKLLEQRSQTFIRGIKDVYTGLNFYPTSTQPTRVKMMKVGENEDETITYDTTFVNPNIRSKVTGLRDVPLSIFEDIEDEELKNAILEQQAYEKSFVN
ncbi:unnamed protein product [Debaryomyces tyrocola]|nr:unnamed protein product [Debaryomyces tyrocola]